MEVRMILAKKLKEFRELSGMKLDEVGARVGKSGKTISAWEKGRGQPDADMLLMLCEIYEVENISEFYDQQRDKNLPSREGLRIGLLYDKADDHDQQTVEHVLSRYDEYKKGMPAANKVEKTG